MLSRTKSYFALRSGPKWVLGTRPRSYLLLGGSIGIAFLVLLSFALPFSPLYSFLLPAKKASAYKFALSSLASQVCTDPVIAEDVEIPSLRTIPNIVHYVWILKDPTVFRLNFQHFISFYSAHLYFAPNKIYIHTDAAPEVFAHAKKSGDDWTRRILALPHVEYNLITVPKETRKGVKIKHTEHKADFLRMEALYNYGGIYLDSDVIPLRSLADLRNSGFANIVGGGAALSMKHSGFVNNGVMLAAPRTTMMDVYMQAAQEYFDGGWATASIYLLTDIARRMAAIPGEVLLLHPVAFSPMSWEKEDQERLFKPHLLSHPRLENQSEPPDRPVASVLELKTCREVFGWVEANEKAEKGRDGWEVDFSSSYVLHAFDDDVKNIRGWDHVVDLKYVLGRRSVFARAVYGAVAHAIRNGVIPLLEAQGQGWREA